MELLSDERMAGSQHFGFKLSTDAKGDDRVFSGDANGSVSLELAQLSVRPGTVPISIVLYMMPHAPSTGSPSGPYTVSFD